MSDEMVELVISDVKSKMEKAVAHTCDEFSGVRTGRASTTLVEKLKVNYHGSEVPLQQIAGLSIPEGQTIMISPYDPSALESIQTAISASDLGLTPNTDGSVIRLSIPPLTEDLRKDMVKTAKNMAEEGKVTIRNNRRGARTDLIQLSKDGDISKDDLVRSEKELDELTHSNEAEIDKAFEIKEKELLET